MFVSADRNTQKKRGRPFEVGNKAAVGGGGGRPSDEARRLAREHGKDCFKVLGQIVSDSNGGKIARIQAAKVLLGYGFGQPRQEVDQHVEVGQAALGSLIEALKSKGHTMESIVQALTQRIGEIEDEGEKAHLTH